MVLWPFTVVFIVFTGPSLAAITNRTIDDTKGDSVTANPVVYQGLWNSKPCLQCLIQPDPAQAFDGTWTEATYFQQSHEPINATLTFTGIAIWVFFILANNAGTPTVSKTTANITLDDQPSLLYEHIPDVSTTNFQYHALVFSQTNLANVHHALVISVSGIQEEVYVNFDYAIYTHEDIPGAPVGEPAANPIAQSPALPNSSSQSGGPQLTDSVQSTESVSGTFAQPLTTQPPTNIAFVIASQSTSPGLVTSTSVSSRFFAATPTATDLSSQHAKSTVPVRVIAGGGVGAGDDSKGISNTRGTVDLSDNKNRSRVYGEAGDIDDDRLNTTAVTFPLGSSEQAAGSKSSGMDGMGAKSSIPPATLLSDVVALGGTTQANSNERMENLRRLRQQEIEQRLLATSQEKTEIFNKINYHRYQRPLPTHGQLNERHDQGAHANGGASTNGQMSVGELQEALRQMGRQIGYLQQQQQSAWAQGLSDDPPPGYTTDTSI